MKRILVLSTILVILMFPFQTFVQAQTSNLEDFKQYDSFQKKYYDHATDLMYLASVSYDSNEHYFKENMELWRSAANEAFDLHPEGFINGMFDSWDDLFSKPISFLLAANDVRKALFDKIKSVFGEEEYLEYIGVPEGYYIAVENQVTWNGSINVDKKFISVGVTYDTNFSGYVIGFRTENSAFYYSFDVHRVKTTEAQNAFFLEFSQKQQSGTGTLTDIIRAADVYGKPKITIKSLQDQSELPTKNLNIPPTINNVINNITDSNNSNAIPEALKDYTPTVQPQLVCPDGTHDLQYTDGSFYTKQRNALVVNPDETVEFNGAICNLDFEFPEIYYHDDTNKLIVGGQDFSTLPGAVAPIDNGLLDYIRNSYNYAVNAVQTGVQGLQTVTSGFVGITTLAGSVFAFLPPEILMFITGAFLVTVGLWVVKK